MSELNSYFKALADPTRRKIILLLKENDLTAGQISEHFDISKPSISHHLNILKSSLLITDERHGQNIYYSLNTTVLQEVLNWFFNVMHLNDGGIENEEDK